MLRDIKLIYAFGDIWRRVRWIFSPSSSHPDPPGRISPAAPMVLVRLGLRESRACPEYRDRRHIIGTLRRTLGGFVVCGLPGRYGEGLGLIYAFGDIRLIYALRYKVDICLRRYRVDIWK